MTAPAYWTDATCATAGTAYAHLIFRPETAAEREARRLELLREAQTWREIARQFGEHKRVFMLSQHTPPTTDAMEARWFDHHCATPIRVRRDTPDEWTAIRVLRALFLALECEDEAAALKPRRSSGKRPAGGKK